MKKCFLKLTTLVVVFGLVFFVTACPKAPAEAEVTVIKESKANIPFDRLEEVGFKAENIQLPESFVNDKVISEAKQLYYDFYYSRDLKKDNLFSPTNIFHQANVKEDDVGKDSKATVDYAKLKKANGGGDISIGTKFLYGVTVKDQYGVLRYKSTTVVSVTASNNITSTESKKVKIKGDHTSFDKADITVSDGTISSVEYNGGYTVYGLSVGGKVVSLNFGEYGETGKVLVKN